MLKVYKIMYEKVDKEGTFILPNNIRTWSHSNRTDRQHIQNRQMKGFLYTTHNKLLEFTVTRFSDSQWL